MALTTLQAPKVGNLPKKRGIMVTGPAGIGKSTTAVMAVFNGEPFYIKDPATITFDGYQNEAYCLIDDLNPESRITPLLKNLINVMPARMNVKYGTLMLTFDRVLVTTQYQLADLCGHDRSLIEAL